MAPSVALSMLPGATSTRPGPTVLVLGATGFIGRALVQRLLADGVSLRALVRDPSRLVPPQVDGQVDTQAGAQVEWVRGDLSDPGSVEAALDGIGQVYHLARTAGRSWDEQLRLDVEPTRRLAELCAERSITLVYASSIAIYDGGRRGAHVTESTPPCAAAMRLNAYARAKVTIERHLAQLHQQQGLKVVVFRPGIVLGAGGNPHHPGVGAWPDPSTCRPWGGGHHPLPFVLVTDCAQAMARALHRPDLAGASFNLIGDAQLTATAYLDTLQAATGKTIARRPRAAWRLFAQSLVKWLIQWPPWQGVPAWPSYRYVDGLSCRAVYANDQAKRQLAWVPAFDVEVLKEEGIRRAVRQTAPGPGAAR